MAKTHPHIDQPTEQQLADLVAGRPEALRETYLALHRLVLDAVPGIKASADTVDAQVGYGAHQFGYNGWGLAAVSPHSKWVSFFLMKGAELPDPDGLLNGGTAMRHVKLQTAGQVAELEPWLRSWLAAAVQLNNVGGTQPST